MTAENRPFTCSHSPNLPDILFKLNCTIAISTYQAGKLIFIGAKDSNKIVQLPRTFQKPMGIAIHQNKLAIACQNEVIVFSNARRMAKNYPLQPDTYDALYLPRSIHFTGEIDIHDLHWVGETLWCVNTRFSCLATLDHHYSFTPRWNPSFIKNMLPEDQCHLNGVAFDNNIPKYVTALSKTETKNGWRETKAKGGILIEVASQEIILDGLQMPHSPRLYDGKLYILESASGNLVMVDPNSRTRHIVLPLNGFVRGMDKISDYLFIGLSQLRKTSMAFNDLPIAKKSIFCGVAIVHLPSAKIIGYLKYENSVEEIYDVRILPGMRRPNLLTSDKIENHIAITTPEQDYWAVVEDKNKND